MFFVFYTITFCIKHTLFSIGKISHFAPIRQIWFVYKFVYITTKCRIFRVNTLRMGIGSDGIASVNFAFRHSCCLWMWWQVSPVGTAEVVRLPRKSYLFGSQRLSHCRARVIPSTCQSCFLAPRSSRFRPCRAVSLRHDCGLHIM